MREEIDEDQEGQEAFADQATSEFERLKARLKEAEKKAKELANGSN